MSEQRNVYVLLSEGERDGKTLRGCEYVHFGFWGANVSKKGD